MHGCIFDLLGWTEQSSEGDVFGGEARHGRVVSRASPFSLYCYTLPDLPLTTTNSPFPPSFSTALVLANSNLGIQKPANLVTMRFLGAAGGDSIRTRGEDGNGSSTDAPDGLATPSSLRHYRTYSSGDIGANPSHTPRGHARSASLASKLSRAFSLTRRTAGHARGISAADISAPIVTAPSPELWIPGDFGLMDPTPRAEKASGTRVTATLTVSGSGFRTGGSERHFLDAASQAWHRIWLR